MCYARAGWSPPASDRPCRHPAPAGTTEPAGAGLHPAMLGVMPTAVALLVAALGRCRYCTDGVRCSACRDALATLEAALVAARPIPYATRAAAATAHAVRNAGQSGNNP
jgi:hypothetical protein